MAYSEYNQDPAFNKGHDEEGWDYISAMELIKRVQATGIGRTYVDEEGNVIYESRFARTA